MPDLDVPILLVATAVAYAMTSGALALSRRLAFLAGLAVAAVALIGPLDARAHHHFSAHMTQHLLLISVAAPLLALGRPLDVARSLMKLGPSRPPSMTGVVSIALFQATVLLAWHVPDAYQAGVDNEAVHALEHLTMVATAFALWSSLAASRGTLRGGALLVLFIVGLPPMAYGVGLTLAPASFYPAYSLADQQLAGVLMWAWGGAAATVGAVALFATWLATGGRES
jgi:putative membrane protein